MKLGCCLNNSGSILLDAAAKGGVCVACTDSDGIKCELGAMYIAIFREKQDQEQELENKSIEAILLMQNEIMKEEKKLNLNE